MLKVVVVVIIMVASINILKSLYYTTLKFAPVTHFYKPDSISFCEQAVLLVGWKSAVHFLLNMSRRKYNSMSELLNRSTRVLLIVL